MTSRSCATTSGSRSNNWLYQSTAARKWLTGTPANSTFIDIGALCHDVVPGSVLGDPVRQRGVLPARLVAQARACGKAGRPGDAGDDRQDEARRHLARERDRDLPLAGRLRVFERPGGLSAVRAGDRHADPRARAVGVTLVVERDDDLDELALRHRSGIRGTHARDWFEQ